jgi:anti-sigma regulatory factor (Ser/Thr protein kinase)
VESLDVGGTLLGAFEDVVVEERPHALGIGDVLVLHTDGVTDAAGAGDRFGDERLLQHLQRAAGRRAEQIVAEVHAAVLDFTGGLAHDDLAIVAVGAVAAGDVHGVLLDRRLPHTAAAPAQARRLLDHVSAAVGDAELLETMRLAVSEMVTNAVRHAPTYDDVVLRVTRNPHCVRIEVQNTGQPFLPPGSGEPEVPSGMSEHGRGLLILGEVASRTGVGFDGERTQVWCEFDM